MSTNPPARVDLRSLFGFGVAGNFAGHLEQAGEAADFASVVGLEAEAPKGIFPWYVPDAEAGSPVDARPAADDRGDDGRLVPSFLRSFPLSSDEIALPAGEAVNLQIEPEVGLLARVVYGSETGFGGGRVVRLVPEAVAAFNDCSIRRPGAKKISHKKNWGASSKGVASTFLPIDDLDPTGPTSTFRLACFLRRDGRTEAYGIDSALPDYSYYGDRLLGWIVDRLANQAGSDDSPLEPVGGYLRAAGNPGRVLIGIGATRYTPLGASTYLQLGDESIVVVYDASVTAPDALRDEVAAGREDDVPAASALRQRVVSAG